MKNSLLIFIAGLIGIGVSVWLLQSQNISPAQEDDPAPSSLATVDSADSEEQRGSDSSTSVDAIVALPGSLESKRARVRDFAAENGYSNAQIRQTTNGLASAFFDPKNIDATRDRIFSELEKNVGTAEATFYSSAIDANDWNEAKRLINERSLVSGQNYDDLRLKIGISTGEITVDEIAKIVNRGTAIPPNAIHTLARGGHIDKIVELVEQNYLANPNTVNPINGRNALSEIINHIGLKGYKYSPEDAREAVEKLIAVGIETKPQNGTFDPLDYALRSVKSHNTKVKVAMATALISNGVPFEDSHRELIEAIPPGKNKDEFVRAFANYL